VEAAVKTVRRVPQGEVPARDARQDMPRPRTFGGAHASTDSRRPARAGHARASASPRPGATSIAGMWNGTCATARTRSAATSTWLRAAGALGLRTWWLPHRGADARRPEDQYVPPERGVVTVIVQSVHGSPADTGYVVEFSFEHSSNGYLTRNTSTSSWPDGCRAASCSSTTRSAASRRLATRRA
jgi:hypothetical protein